MRTNASALAPKTGIGGPQKSAAHAEGRIRTAGGGQSRSYDYNSSVNTHGIRFVALVAFATLTCRLHAGEHPSLLIRASDLARIRHACGTGPAPENAADLSRSGHRASDFQAIRSYVLAHLSAASSLPAIGEEAPTRSSWLPGELLAGAFLHLADPTDPVDMRRVAFIRDALAAPSFSGEEALEALIALDWCWDALSREQRRAFFGTIRPNLRPLAIGESPLEHELFRDRLAALAAAIVFDADEDLGETWAETRTAILGAARPWFDKTLPTFITWRGVAPVTPETGPWEELDTALAIEFASLLGGDAWIGSGKPISRWMEHYLLADSGQIGRPLGFVRDLPGSGVLSPLATLDGLQALTAHLIAVRTRDPAAATVADGVERELSRASDVRAHAWRWVPIAMDTRGIQRIDTALLPVARNLGSAVVLRGHPQAKSAVVWIDAGQPFLVPRQHFDAGAFWIRRGNADLAVSAADERVLFAQRQSGGEQRLGRTVEAFDFAQFNASTIAHNAMLFVEPNRVTRWYGKLFVPQGGQPPREGICREFVKGLEEQDRSGGRISAYGHHEQAAYVAVDLSAAYDTRTVIGYTREYFWFGGSGLLVVDRARTANPRVVPVFTLNLPSRPRLATGPLEGAGKIAGASDEAGIWNIEPGTAIRVSIADAGLKILPLLPENRRVVAVGGPGEPVSFSASPGATRPYIGGGPSTFERLVNPTRIRSTSNAWFRLGKPPRQAEQMAYAPLWGRIEVEASGGGTEHVFATLLEIGASDGESVLGGQFEMGEADRAGVFHITMGDTRIQIELASVAGKGGTIRGDDWQWKLPDHVLPDPPLATK